MLSYTCKCNVRVSNTSLSMLKEAMDNRLKYQPEISIIYNNFKNNDIDIIIMFNSNCKIKESFTKESIIKSDSQNKIINFMNFIHGEYRYINYVITNISTTKL